jgi:hypothetical protein
MVIKIMSNNRKDMDPQYFLYSSSMVTHTYNPSYLGSGDQEDLGSRPA